MRRALSNAASSRLPYKSYVSSTFRIGLLYKCYAFNALPHYQFYLCLCLARISARPTLWYKPPALSRHRKYGKANGDHFLDCYMTKAILSIGTLGTLKIAFVIYIGI